jgi:hypothetical protein
MEQWGFVWRSDSGARRSLVLAVLCIDTLCLGGGGFLDFLTEQVVLGLNLSQWLPLLCMKLVISRKAWYMTTRLSGMVDDDVVGDGGD